MAEAKESAKAAAAATTVTQEKGLLDSIVEEGRSGRMKRRVIAEKT